jgi:hypothetical protein
MRDAGFRFAPSRNSCLRMCEAGEPVLIEAFVAQAPVERFDANVLRGLAERVSRNRAC